MSKPLEHRGRRNCRYRLSPWPGLASFIRRGRRDRWIPSQRAGHHVLHALLPFPHGWFHPRSSLQPFPPGIRLLKDGTLVERSGQALLPLAEIESLKEPVRIYAEAAAFQAAIPPRIRVLVKRFPRHHLSLLRILSAVPETEGLARSHPAMFVLMARRYERSSTHEIPRAEVRALLARPHHQLLSLLTGQPHPRAAARLVAKIPPHLDFEPSQVHALALAVAQPHFGHALPHLKSLTDLQAKALAEPALWPHLSPALIRDLGQARWRRADSVLAQLQAGAATLNRLMGTSAGKAPRFRGVRELLAFRDSLLNRAPQKRLQPAGTKLPEAPIPANGDLAPLRTVGEFLEEGRSQRNCLATPWQVERALNGQTAGAKLLAPERATVLLSWIQGFGWVIEDIRGFGDRPVRISTVLHAVRVLGIPADPPWLPWRAAEWLSDGRPYAFMPKVRTGDSRTTSQMSRKLDRCGLDVSRARADLSFPWTPSPCSPPPTQARPSL